MGESSNGGKGPYVPRDIPELKRMVAGVRLRKTAMRGLNQLLFELGLQGKRGRNNPLRSYVIASYKHVYSITKDERRGHILATSTVRRRAFEDHSVETALRAARFINGHYSDLPFKLRQMRAAEAALTMLYHDLPEDYHLNLADLAKLHTPTIAWNVANLTHGKWITLPSKAEEHPGLSRLLRTFNYDPKRGELSGWLTPWHENPVDPVQYLKYDLFHAAKDEFVRGAHYQNRYLDHYMRIQDLAERGHYDIAVFKTLDSLGNLNHLDTQNPRKIEENLVKHIAYLGTLEWPSFKRFLHRSEQGRKLYAEYHQTLDRMQKRFGQPLAEI